MYRYTSSHALPIHACRIRPLACAAGLSLPAQQGKLPFVLASAKNKVATLAASDTACYRSTPCVTLGGLSFTLCVVARAVQTHTHHALGWVLRSLSGSTQKVSSSLANHSRGGSIANEDRHHIRDSGTGPSGSGARSRYENAGSSPPARPAGSTYPRHRTVMSLY